MPNHVTTKITASPIVLKSMLNEDGNIDFNMIKKGFDDGQGNGIRGDIENLAKSCLPFKPDGFLSNFEMNNILESDVRKLDDESFDRFICMLKNVREHGYIHSMEFQREEWGTKWNAYQQKIEDEALEFQTAWSNPFSLLKALSEKFPDEMITVLYADEDMGANCGHYVLLDGSKTFNDEHESYHDSSDEEKARWRKFAFYLLHGDDAKPSDFELDENFNYIEE